VILEHSVLGLYYLSSPYFPSLVLCITCLVPALYPLLSCIPCLGSAPQYILCAYSVHSFPVCITSTSIPASLRCTCFDIARQIFSTPCRHSGQTPHRPRRTLRPTDRNISTVLNSDLDSLLLSQHFAWCCQYCTCQTCSSVGASLPVFSTRPL
jgi:hypothetical protein